MVLLAKNFEGYKNLAKLSSIGFVEGFYFGVPRISREIIAQYKENLIALSGGLLGDIPSLLPVVQRFLSNNISLFKSLIFYPRESPHGQHYFPIAAVSNGS